MSCVKIGSVGVSQYEHHEYMATVTKTFDWSQTQPESLHIEPRDTLEADFDPKLGPLSVGKPAVQSFVGSL